MSFQNMSFKQQLWERLEPKNLPLQHQQQRGCQISCILIFWFAASNKIFLNVVVARKPVPLAHSNRFSTSWKIRWFHLTSFIMMCTLITIFKSTAAVEYIEDIYWIRWNIDFISRVIIENRYFMIYTSVSQPKSLRDPFFTTTCNFWVADEKQTFITKPNNCPKLKQLSLKPYNFKKPNTFN